MNYWSALATRVAMWNFPGSLSSLYTLAGSRVSSGKLLNTCTLILAHDICPNWFTSCAVPHDLVHSTTFFTHSTTYHLCPAPMPLLPFLCLLVSVTLSFFLFSPFFDSTALSIYCSLFSPLNFLCFPSSSHLSSSFLQVSLSSSFLQTSPLKLHSWGKSSLLAFLHSPSLFSFPLCSLFLFPPYFFIFLHSPSSLLPQFPSSPTHHFSSFLHFPCSSSFAHFPSSFISILLAHTFNKMLYYALPPATHPLTACCVSSQALVIWSLFSVP